jgi:CRP/FNR family transcriptional regulator, cyclic AMP receptor protein
MNGTKDSWPNGTFMSRLDAQTAGELLALAPKHEYAADTRLLTQGDRGDHVYLLRSIRTEISACVKVTAIAENGTETMLGIRVNGDLVGELAGLRDGFRSATVVTCTRMYAHLIPHGTLLPFLLRRAKAWRAVAQMIADRLAWANRRRIDIGGYEVPVRLARVMIELADRHGVDTPTGRQLGVRLSQTELGRLIGAGEDAVGQAMRQLRSAGLVTPLYRAVVVTNMPELRAFAELPR